MKHVAYSVQETPKLPQGNIKKIQKKILWSLAKERAETELKEYLLSHEDKIASGENDFAYLRFVFEYYIGRAAK